MDKQIKTVKKRPRRTMLLHSDRGSIYGDEKYIQRLAARGVKPSSVARCVRRSAQNCCP